MKNYSPNSELHWGENELRLFMWILANYLQIKKIYIDQLVQTLKLRVETIGSISAQSSPTSRASSSNTKPSVSTKNPLPPRSGPQKKIKYLPLWSGILALIQKQRRQIQVERTRQGTLHRVESIVLQDPQTVQRKVAEPSRPQQIKRGMGPQVGFYSYLPRLQQGQKMGGNIQAPQK
jgi:hypothetical protein